MRSPRKDYDQQTDPHTQDNIVSNTECKISQIYSKLNENRGGLHYYGSCLCFHKMDCISISYVDSKSQMKSKLHHWLKSYSNFTSVIFL